MFEVKARPGSEVLGPDTCGAFVNAVGFATDAEDFSRRVSEVLDLDGLDVVGSQDVELYADRVAKFEVPASLREVAESLSADNPVAFDSFHTFPSE